MSFHKPQAIRSATTTKTAIENPEPNGFCFRKNTNALVSFC
jgi:hypothetical protein